MHPVVEALPRIDIRQLRRDGRVPKDVDVKAMHLRLTDGRELTVQLARRTEGQIGGGVRLFMLCPYCYRRRELLYVTSRHVACRVCLKLWYASQVYGTVQRTTNRLCKLRRRLGDDSGQALGPEPDKPKWMRWSTYDRKIDQILNLEDRSIAHMDLSLERFLRKYGA